MKHPAGVSLVWLAAMAVLLTACSSPAPPVSVRASIDAGQNINPDIHGRASPVVVRIYELKTLAAFNDLDFFSLYERDKETLGADMLGREELQLKPGESRAIVRKLQPDTRYVGVIAAFRDLQRAQWRASVPVPTASGWRSTMAATGLTSKDVPLTISLEKTRISISAPP